MAAGLISRAAMVAAIKEGGSVHYKGALITRLENLPSEAELAVGDPVQEQQALTDLQKEIAGLEARKAALQAQANQQAQVSQQAADADKSAAGGAGQTPPPVDPDKVLASLNLEQLKAVAQESGVADIDKLTKPADLIAAIKAKSAQG